jgi:chromosome segregation ATPase
MEKDCDSKSAEWATIVKTRQEELLALADTIKILNDDDALEMFKKTLPGASASFVQVRVNERSARSRAMLEIMRAQQAALISEPQLDFIALAIRGQKIGFEKVIKLIDEMVGTLNQEQLDDDHKKEYCAAQFDLSDDKKKALEKSVSDLGTAITEAKDGIVTLVGEIDALEDGIKALDKSVAEATEQRKEEHEEFTETMSSNAAAKELLGFAKNRLNKFYNPKLYKPPAASLLQVSAHHQNKKDAPPPPPEAPGAYKKKGEESTGVIAMIDMLIADLDKEIQEIETSEKENQEEYDTFMEDSADKRRADSLSLEEKEGAKASSEAALQKAGEEHHATLKEAMATAMYIGDLHKECDWLLMNFDARKAARTGEVESLTNAKAVLSGADYSLVQTKFLRRRT